MSHESSTFRLLKRRPSFLGGMASILDFSKVSDKYRFDRTDDEADLHAIQSDWETIGQDMRYAINEYVTETKKSAKPTE